MKTQPSTLLPLLQTLAEIDGDEWTIEDYRRPKKRTDIRSYDGELADERGMVYTYGEPKIEWE